MTSTLSADGHLKVRPKVVRESDSDSRVRHTTVGKLVVDVHAAAGCEELLEAFLPADETSRRSDSSSLQVHISRSRMDPPDTRFGDGSHHFRRGMEHAWSSTMPRQLQTLVVAGHGEATLQVDEASTKDGAIRARPAVDAISAWAASCGTYPVHASSIAKNRDALLLVGESGTGKTTTALSLAMRGWQLLADDRSFLTVDERNVVVSGLYRTAILTDQVARKHPEFIGEPLGVTHTNKVACRLPTAVSPVSDSRLRGVVHLSAGRVSPYRLHRVGLSECLRIWQDTLFPTVQAIGLHPELLALVSHLAQTIPIARMSIDWDLDRLEKTMTAHLESIRYLGMAT